MKVHYPKLYNMAHLLALNVLLLPKDLIIIFIHYGICGLVEHVIYKYLFSEHKVDSSLKVHIPMFQVT